MEKYLETELSKWIPRLSGAAFKCLFVICLELAAAVPGVTEVVISRRHFVAETGLSKSAVQTALAELVAVRAVTRRPTKGGALAYSVPGLIFNRDENKPGQKSTLTDFQPVRPKDLFELLLWHWRKNFNFRELPTVEDDARFEIVGLLRQFSYKYLRQSLKGLASLGDFEAIKLVLDPETAVKTVKKGYFLYFDWRDARLGGDE